MSSKETVSDVCARIKERVGELWEQDLGSMLNGEVDEFADRILAAHKREMAGEIEAKDVEIANLRVAACGAYYKESHMSEDMDAKDAEIARLRAALKPVLECDTDFDVCGAFEEGDIDTVAAPFDAVRAAKRIYNESEVNRG